MYTFTQSVNILYKCLISDATVIRGRGLNKQPKDWRHYPTAKPNDCRWVDSVLSKLSYIYPHEEMV